MKRKTLVIAITILLISSSHLFAMNSVKGWINKIKPGTFETEESAQKAQGEEQQIKTFNEAEIRVLTSLAKRESELQKKEAIHNQKAAELKSLSQQIEQKLDQIQKLTAEFERKRQLRKEMDERDISRMVRLYEIMDPELSAEKFNDMDIITTTHIIMRMNPRKAASILELMDTKVAVEITELVTRFKADRTKVVQN